MPYERLERAVPPDDPVVGVDDDQAVVERLEDVLVELAHALDLVGLGLQLLVQPPVLEAVATWAATATSSAMSSLLSGSPRSLRPRASTAMRRLLGHAGHEVVHALARARTRPRRSPARRSGGRVVERHVVPATARARRRRSRARSSGGSPTNPCDADGAERVGGLVGQHQRHAVDDQRLGDARDQALARAAAGRGRCSGRARTPPARAGSRSGRGRTRGRARSGRVLDRPRQQHDHHRREHRDDRVARAAVGEDPARPRGAARRRGPRSPAAAATYTRPRLTMTSTSISR